MLQRSPRFRQWVTYTISLPGARESKFMWILIYPFSAKHTVVRNRHIGVFSLKSISLGPGIRESGKKQTFSTRHLISKSTAFLGKCNIVNIVQTLCTLYILATATISPTFQPVTGDFGLQSSVSSSTTMTLQSPPDFQNLRRSSIPIPNHLQDLWTSHYCCQVLTQPVLILMPLLSSMPVSKSLDIFLSTSWVHGTCNFLLFETSLQLDGKLGEAFG